MQFTQPGFPNYGQPFTFNTPFPYNVYSEVIGEGNVTSVMSPDGSAQLLFLPTTPWWRPYPCNINVGNVNQPNWNPTGAWFIRSVFSPIQPMACNQQFQAPCGVALPRSYSSECCFKTPPGYTPNFELKFHNDICTSTSDIHYFYPALRPCNWLQKPQGCASVQVDVPMMANSLCQYEVTYSKPCCCAPTDETQEKSKCNCGKTTDNSASDMSCESDKSENLCPCQKDKSGNYKASKTKKKSVVICECKEPNKKERKKEKSTDKSVTTCTDQASGCVAEKGRETQTACESIQLSKAKSDLCKKHMKAEIWKPKTPTSKKAMKTKSKQDFTGVHESGCFSETCSCHSDTD